MFIPLRETEKPQLIMHIPTNPDPDSRAGNKQIIQTSLAPRAIGPYSQAVRVGNLLFLSGQIPLDPATGNPILSTDIRSQTDRVLLNLEAILRVEKLSLADVVKTTVFLTNLGEFAEMNEVYARYFPGAPPARSTVQVVGLPKGVKVEIEALACYPVAS